MPATRKLAVSACYEAAERPETVASQPASHRRRPLEELFIVDGTNKYRLNGREVRYPTSERITTILALHGEHSTTTLVAFQFSVSINFKRYAQVPLSPIDSGMHGHAHIGHGPQCVGRLGRACPRSYRGGGAGQMGRASAVRPAA